ncbi:MAG: hypothetical protein ACKO3P_04065 [Planctomycetaceae bacterium]
MEGWELDLVVIRQFSLQLGQRLWKRWNPALRLVARPVRPELLPGLAVFGGLLAVALLYLMWWARNSSPPVPSPGPGPLGAAGLGLLATTILGVELLRPVGPVRRYWPLLVATVWLAAFASTLPSLIRHPVASLGVLLLGGLSGEWIRQQLSSSVRRRWITGALAALPPLLRRLADSWDRVPRSNRPEVEPRAAAYSHAQAAAEAATSCGLATPDGLDTGRATSSPPGTRAAAPLPGHTPAGREVLSLRRVIEPAGDERVFGTLQVDFAAGQSLVVAHLPFSPLMALTPQVQATLAEGAPARIKSCVAYPYGVRLELKRVGSGKEALGVRVDVVAVGGRQPRRAA